MNARRVVALLIGVAVLGSSAASWAEPKARESGAEQVAYGAGSFLTTLVYAPVKASFCVLGAVGSGFALPFAGPKKAGSIAESSCSGTWILTPSILKGKEQVKFVGRSS
jgi:hypothetical protein